MRSYRVAVAIILAMVMMIFTGCGDYLSDDNIEYRLRFKDNYEETDKETIKEYNKITSLIIDQLKALENDNIDEYYEKVNRTLLNKYNDEYMIDAAKSFKEDYKDEIERLDDELDAKLSYTVEKMIVTDAYFSPTESEGYLYLKNSYDEENCVAIEFKAKIVDDDIAVVINNLSTEKIVQLKESNDKAITAYNYFEENFQLIRDKYKTDTIDIEYDLDNDDNDEIHKELKNAIGYGTVYVHIESDIEDTSDESFDDKSFFVQWRSVDYPNIIGQYPKVPSRDEMNTVKWGEFHYPQ